MKKNELKDLIDLARSVKSTPKEREEQRRSFAYGNAAFENTLITREMVVEIAEKKTKSKDA